MDFLSREALEADGIRVVLKNMAGNKKAFSVPNGDGYLLVINSNLGHQARLDALLHKLKRIDCGDHFHPDYIKYAFRGV